MSPTATANDKHTEYNAAGPVASNSFLRVPLSPFRGKSGIFPLVFGIVKQHNNVVCFIASADVQPQASQWSPSSTLLNKARRLSKHVLRILIEFWLNQNEPIEPQNILQVVSSISFLV